MFRQRRVAVVIPAYNEADKIAAAIRSVPGFVDHVIVVDDGSADATAAVARRAARRASGRRSGGGRQVEVIVHAHNRGVGAAIATGYARALALGADATAVMAGDGQMDPADLPRLLGAGRRRHGRLRQGESLRLAGRVAADAAGAAGRQRGAVVADPRGVGVLAALRLAVRIHGGLAARAAGDRSRADVRALRLSQRSAGAAGRRRRARRRRAGASGLRAGLALGVASGARRAADRLALAARVRRAASAPRSGARPVLLGARRRRADWPPDHLVSRATRATTPAASSAIACSGCSTRGTRSRCSPRATGPARTIAAVDGPLTVRRVPAAVALLRRGGARGARARRRGLARGGAVPGGARGGGARARGALGRGRVALARPLGARGVGGGAAPSPPRLRALGRRRAARADPARARDRAPARAATGPTSASSAPSCRRGSRALRGRADGRAASARSSRSRCLPALFSPRAGPTPPCAGASASRRPRCWRWGGWCRSRGTRLCFTPAPACAPRPLRLPRPEVVILGDGPERARLARLAAALEVPLRLAGAVAARRGRRVAARRRSLRAAVRSDFANGRTEGAPIAAREARAVGIPVVATSEVAALARAIGMVSGGRSVEVVRL